MSGTTFSIRVTLDTSGMAPAPHEQFPVVKLWTSFSGAKHFAVEPAEVPRGKVISAPFEFIGIPVPLVDRARADDAIWFEVMALDSTCDGESQVRQRTGSGFVYYKELAAVESSVSLDMTLFNYWDENDERFKKAKLLLEPIGLMPVYEDTEPDMIQFLPNRDTLIQGLIESAIHRSIDYYTKDGAARGDGLFAQDPKDALVHAPAWNGPTGWRPGYMYFVHPGDRAPRVVTGQFRKHMRSTLEAALWRAGQTERWFIDAVTAQLERTDDVYDDQVTLCCDVLGEAFCAVATSLPYIGDTVISARRGAGGTIDKVSTHGTESFDFASRRGGGDCEDLARLIHAYRCAITDTDWVDELLMAASALSKLYTGFGVLTSVLGAQLSDAHRGDPFIIGTRRDDDVKIGAHMYYQLVPHKKAAIWIRRVQPDADFDALFGESIDAMAPWRDKLPHLVLEGTGKLQTLQRPMASYPVEPETKALWKRRAQLQDAAEHFLARTAVSVWRGKVVSLMALTQTIRRQQLTKRLPNARVGGFYRNAVHMFTDDFIQRGFPTAEFLVVNLGEPQLVPEDASADYSDDTMLQGAAADVSSRLKQLELDMADPEPVGTEPSWRRKESHSLDVHADLTAEERAKDRMDRFPYGKNERVKSKYGAPLSSLLEDRPMLDHLALAAGAPLDGAAAAAVGLHFRHSEPVPLAGDLDFARDIREAQLDSARAGGIDVDKVLDAQTSGVESLERSLEALFDRKAWDESALPYERKLVPVTLFINTTLAANPNVAAFIANALKNVSVSVGEARWRVEEFVAGRSNLVIQLALEEIAVEPFVKDQ